MSARAYGQLVMLTTLAACAVISLLQGWYATSMILLVALVLLTIG